MPDVPKQLGIFEKEEWRKDEDGRQGLYLHHNGRHVADLRQSLEYPEKMIVRFFTAPRMQAQQPIYVDNIIVAVAYLLQYKEKLDENLHNRTSR